LRGVVWEEGEGGREGGEASRPSALVLEQVLLNVSKEGGR